MPQVEDTNLFFKKILSYGENYICKDYLLFTIVPFRWVFLLSQMFSGMPFLAPFFMPWYVAFCLNVIWVISREEEQNS